MLSFLSSSNAFVAQPVSRSGKTVARQEAPVMIAPGVGGAVLGGAVVGVLSQFIGGGDSKATFSDEAPVTKAEVEAAQKLWAESIAKISKTYADGGDYVAAAGEAAGQLYGYGHGNVLFKPTKATEHPFRATGEVAMSYFVGSKAMNMPEFDGEDAGFAINGGRGWKSVTFRNHQIETFGPVAHAMGDYVFVDATSGDEVRVEYTLSLIHI